MPLLLLGVVGCGGGSKPADGSAQEFDRADATTARVATFPSLQRLTPSVDLATGEDAIELVAARGEREGGQFVAVFAKAPARIVVVASALEGPGTATIPARLVETWLEQSIEVEQGSPAGRAGSYLDPLVPAAGRDVEVRPDARLPVWVDVAVPVAAAPGAYAGSVQLRYATEDGKVRADTAVLAEVPLRVTVRGATLPHQPTLKSNMGVETAQVAKFEQLEQGSAKLRTALDAYGQQLADARLSIADVGVLPPGTLPGQAAAPGDAAYLQRQFTRRGVASVRLPFYITYPFEDPLGRDRTAAVRYLRAVADWARRLGVFEQSYVYAIDEPGDQDAGRVRELHELVHEADPRLRLLVTREASARAFQGSVDIWSPNINATRFRPADVVAEHRRGHETWWYPSITTWQPQPDLFIDELRPAPRALGWLAWRYGVDGFLYWSANHWNEVTDPWRDPATYVETDAVGNGDGVLLYPGAPIGQPGIPAPSVRLLQLRDGIDDHDLLTMATCGGTAAQRARLRGLTTAIAPSMTSFDADAADVAELRDVAFDVIEASGDSAKCRS
ncbi:MAG: uncharacterized protein JWM90_2663 [Thermoleophilia bacterium]|nr:uncharacterized protein [Thermoleophilia bacterium]